MASRLSTCESTANSAKQLADSNSSRITACENKDSAQDVSIQNPTVGLSLNTDSKILTVTVNGTSQTIDLSGISGGMKQIKKSYTDYSTFKSDIDNGNIPLGAEVYFSYYTNESTYRTGHFHYLSSTYMNPGTIAISRSSTLNSYDYVSITGHMEASYSSAIIDVLYWE